MIVTLNNLDFKVDIKYKNIKNMYLRTSFDETLYITCNKSISEAEIINFIRSKEKWILKSVIRQEKRHSILDFNTKKIYWLNKAYEVEVVKSKKPDLIISDNKIYIYSKSEDINKVEKVFLEYACKYLYKIIEEKRPIFDEVLRANRYYDKPEIQVKKLRGKWGVCFPRKKHININVDLIHFPLECLYYVLLHEYIHLLVMDHSKKFYDYIKLYMPNYKVYEGILKGENKYEY